MPGSNTPSDVFSRQFLLPEIGREGQVLLLSSHVFVVGVGAVGSRIAEMLARMGVGRLTLIDHDHVDFSNLSRQTLYTWSDAENSIPKAEAARRQINSILPTCQVFPVVEKLDAGNIAERLKGAYVVADGTDDIDTRYLINDWCIENQVPWVYAGAVGTKASVFPVIEKNACLRCAFPEPPDRDSLPTANEAGVIASATSMAAVRSSALILRILLGDFPDPIFETYDVWNGTCSSMTLQTLRASHGDTPCPVCSK